MAFPTPENTLRERGKIEINNRSTGLFEVIFIPPVEALPPGYSDPKKCKLLIALVNTEGKSITIFPFKVWGLHTMEPRYNKLSTITFEITSYYFHFDDNSDFEEILSNLPNAFIKDYNYGLGFLKEYRNIPSFLETLEVKHLFICSNAPTSLNQDNGIFTISKENFQKIIKRINTITSCHRVFVI
jgi:hypothetical protein